MRPAPNTITASTNDPAIPDCRADTKSRPCTASSITSYQTPMHRGRAICTAPHSLQATQLRPREVKQHHRLQRNTDALGPCNMHSLSQPAQRTAAVCAYEPDAPVLDCMLAILASQTHLQPVASNTHTEPILRSHPLSGAVHNARQSGITAACTCKA
jgi:hypothetical protein